MSNGGQTALSDPYTGGQPSGQPTMKPLSATTTGGQYSPGGGQVTPGSVYGMSPVQVPAWGGPDLRWGDTDPGVNAGYAAKAMPGTPASYQQMFSGLAGTPWSSNPNQYGRWNWAGQMPPPQTPQMTPQSPQPNPMAPPIPGQPGTGGGGQPVQPVQPVTGGGQPVQPVTGGGQPGQGINGNTGGIQSPWGPGGGGQAGLSQAAIDRGMTAGDIWSNPAFTNMVAATTRPGGGLFAPSYEWNGIGPYGS